MKNIPEIVWIGIWDAENDIDLNAKNNLGNMV